MADGGWGFKKKKKEEEEEVEENRMLIRLTDLLVNCHLLRNASFGFFKILFLLFFFNLN